MRAKRLLSSLVAAATLCALLVLPAQAAHFSDISDPEVSLAADTLYALGIVSGSGGGNFSPEGALTRVQFCKMAIEAMGQGEQAKAQMNRTIFTDVKGTHWGRGYVNLAATLVIDEETGSRLMMGVGNGQFMPNQNISYREAVTIILRMLGYAAEANRAWPRGAIDQAARLGLDEGLDIADPAAAIDRGQAAVLFCRMLALPRKGESEPFAKSLGTLVDDSIVLAVNATVNGQSGWVVTTSGSYQAAGDPDSALVGQRGAVILDQAGRFVTLLADQSDCVSAVISRAQGNYLDVSSGVRYTFASDTPVYTGSGKTSTYAEVLPDLAAGDVVTIYLEEGKVIGMFRGGMAGDSRFLIAQGSVTQASLALLTGGDSGYTIRKNGSTISMGEIKQYDVLTYDGVSKVLSVCDTRLSCVYENAAPAPEAPTRITAAGGNSFDVMASAVGSFQDLKLGQSITLLFTADGRVAAAMKNGPGSNAMGVVNGESMELLGTRVTLRLNGAANVGSLDGKLASVYSYQRGALQLSAVNLSRGNDSFETASMRLGRLAVSEGVRLYEDTANGLAAVALGDLPDTVPASLIKGYHTDSANRVDVIILNEFTGDGYTYGRIEVSGQDEGQGGQLSFSTSEGSSSYSVNQMLYVRSGFGAVATGSDGTVVGVSYLQEIADVPSSAFYTVDGVTYVQAGGTIYEVADNVQCYNSTVPSGGENDARWFGSLGEARSFSSRLTLYVDAVGQKVRIVSA